MYPTAKIKLGEEDSGRLVKLNQLQTSKKIWVAGASICTASLLLYFGSPSFVQLANKLEPESRISARPMKRSSGGISWWTCPDVPTQKCAYFTVPLDYTNPLPNETVSLFLRKFPATVPLKDRLGTIFFNPGGPGGSGSAAVAIMGEPLSVIVDGRYDILSWDPRGINMTLPPLYCHANDGFAAHAYYEQQQIGLPIDARGPASWPESQKATAELEYFRKFDTYVRASNGACEANGNVRMLKAVSTSFVARDMARMLEALGEEEQGISYWGFSYGTVLGATFAAMYPDLVHRMVLDGVSDAASYTQNLYDWGRIGMDDTAKTYKGFLQACLDAGHELCPLATPGVTTVEILQSRIASLLEDLVPNPLPISKSNVGSGILTASAVQQLIFGSLYTPTIWPTLAQGLAQAQDGDGAFIFELMNGEYVDMHADDMIQNVFNRYMERKSQHLHTFAIMCGDSAPFKNVTGGDDGAKQLQKYFHELGKKSPTGEIWATWITTCRRWNVRPFESYRGPWTVKDGLKKTKFPLLFASLTADPVTPLSAAKSMSQGFGNESATLVIQEGLGHCTPSHPSLCTAKKIRSYFLDGKVPKYGTLCKADPGFLFPNSTVAPWMNHTSPADRKLAKALYDLSGVI